MPGQMDSPTLNSAWVVLTFAGELDMARTPDLDQMAAEVLSRDRVDVVVDLSGVSFMDSSALRWLLNFQDRIDGASGRLRLAAPPGGSLERLLSLSGLDAQFRVFRTLAEATSSIDHAAQPSSFVTSTRAKPAESARKTV